MGFIIDMGNVLSLSVDIVPRIAEKVGLTVAQIESFTDDEFNEMVTGAQTAREFWADFNRHFGTAVREDLLSTLFQPVNDERVERLISELKVAGQRVVCGTNTIEAHYRYHVEHRDYEPFDRVYASHLLGLAKPAPAFFRRILEEEGWKAGDTFFVDDNSVHVAAARKLGIRSFLYESFETLQAWLADQPVLAAR